MRTRPIPMIVALTIVGPRATPAAGQWPRYIAPGIPRLPDGKSSLSAPTPRTNIITVLDPLLVISNGKVALDRLTFARPATPSPNQ
jgi:hypothetical protein